MTRVASRRTGAVVAAGLAIALALAFFVGPHASSSPDGLEKVAADRALDSGTRPHAMANGPLAGYTVRGVGAPVLSTGLAGVLGVAATFAVATAGFALVRRIGTPRVDRGLATPDPPA